MPLHKQGERANRRRRPAVPSPREADPRLQVPLHRMRDEGIDHDVAYELISSELLLDGQARLNLATFVTTWMPSIAGRLMAETADKNMIDKDEYPQTAEIESRCVNIIADLWNCAEATGDRLLDDRLERGGDAGGMALKWRWRERMREAGKPTDKPNLVMGANVQVCWEKFCRYWEVEPRLVPMEGERYHLGRRARPWRSATRTRSASWRSSARRSTAATSRSRRSPSALDRLEADKGLYVPLHVDARLGRIRGAVPPARPRVGLPPPAGAVDQRLGPQVRTRLPGRRLGDLARRGGAAEGPDLRRQLPRRSHADVRAELLPPRAARSSPSTSCSRASDARATAR